MKKILAILLSFSLLTITACSGSSGAQETAETTVAETTTTKRPSYDMSEFFADEEEDDGVMIKNGDFSAGTSSWNTFTQGGQCGLSANNGELNVKILDAGKLDYSVQVYQDGFELVEGCVYKISFDAHSTINRQIESRLQMNGGDYHAYTSSMVDLTSEKQTFTYQFTMSETTDKTPRMVFNMGLPKGVDSLDEHTVSLDNVSIELIDETNKSNEEIKAFEGIDINIDQIGYFPDSTKTVVFRGTDVGKTFNVVNADSGEVVFTGDITGEKENKTAEETDYYGDFSAVKQEGRYYIESEDKQKSYEFNISSNVYKDAFNDSFRMLYLQRCGCDISQETGGKFAHPACHTGKALIYGDESSPAIDVTGGWHDAGDYGRYVVPGAKAAADLILAYECNPSAFSDNQNTKDSNNGIPDVIDEARYELDWMLKMQDSKSGGVYHKVTGENFAGMVMPDKVTDQLYLSPISITATEDFAGVMALASRVYKDFDKDFSDRCKNAAIKAYDYVEGQSTRESFKNPEGISTGEYPDEKYRDERFWAACELYKITGNSKYHDAIKDQITKEFKKGFGWADMGYYGSYSYLTLDKSLRDEATYNKVKEDFIFNADTIVRISQSDGYFVSIKENYCWGSNGAVANDAMALLLANSINPDDKYVSTAQNLLHYILGENALSTCYLTGYGTVSPLHTHHRPSMAMNESMPGMLVGGPDSNLEDPCAKILLKDMPNAKCYIDNAQSFSCNEVTIYWNSPLVFALSYFNK